MIKVSGNINNIDGIERVSRRVQSGVEILERETLRKIRIDEPAADGDTLVSPRLVVSDSRSRNFIAKSRSQLGEIDAFLKSIIRKPINIK